jgi:hypothetical protein
MKRFGTRFVMGSALVALAAGPVFAFHCPAMVKECEATADVVAKRPGTDMAALETARKGCDEALKLHQAGKHKEAMIAAGEAITAISKALK